MEKAHLGGVPDGREKIGGQKMKTLVAYATKGGVTGESAHIIAQILKEKYGFDVDIVNLRKDRTPDMSQYKNVVIGSGIRMGRWYRSALKMLEKDYQDKNVVLFLSACSAGDPMKHDEAVRNYLDAVLAKYPHVKPVAAQAFGGRLRMFGKTIEDNCDMDKIREWAKDVGEKLKEVS